MLQLILMRLETIVMMRMMQIMEMDVFVDYGNGRQDVVDHECG